MIEHAPHSCPLIASAYCSYCAVYGHFTEGCPDTLAEAAYMDVCDSPPAASPAVPPNPAIIELQDDNTTIRGFLIKNGIHPSSKIKDNYKKVEEWAAAGRKRVVYIMH